MKERVAVPSFLIRKKARIINVEEVIRCQERLEFVRTDKIRVSGRCRGADFFVGAVLKNRPREDEAGDFPANRALANFFLIDLVDVLNLEMFFRDFDEVRVLAQAATDQDGFRAAERR